MVNQDLDYPIYRKYENNRSFFKITSSKNFMEIQVMGNTYFKYEMEAKILPDFHLINDMISMHNNHWVLCPEKEFIEVFTQYNLAQKSAISSK